MGGALAMKRLPGVVSLLRVNSVATLRVHNILAGSTQNLLLVRSAG